MPHPTDYPLFSTSNFQDEVLELAREQMFGLSNDGICCACGNIQGGCEPDARAYPCESCGEKAVYGAPELLLYISA